VELLYWAEMATNNAWQSATASDGNASIVTAKYKNYTLTSPTVYIEFQTAYATNVCGQTVGHARPGALLPVDPKSLRSLQAQNDYFVETLAGGSATSFYQTASFNFLDLHGFPAPSAYFAQPSCLLDGCTIVRSDDYRPVLMLPSQIRNMDPAWKTCGLDFRGAWDPPIALHPADSVDPVITSSEPTHTMPASPQSTADAPALQTEHSQTYYLVSSAVSSLHSPSSTTVQQEATHTSPVDLSTLSSTSSPVDEHGTNAIVSFVAQPFGTALVSSSVAYITTTYFVLSQPARSDPTHSSRQSTSEANSADLTSPYSPTFQPIAESLHDPTFFASNPLSSTTRTSSFEVIVAESQIISVIGSSALALDGTTITVGGEVVTKSNVVYSAASDAGLVAISKASRVPILTSSPSPTNALEILTAALPHSAVTSMVTIIGVDGRLHSIAHISDGYAVDDVTTIQPGQAVSISGLGDISADADGQIYGISVTKSTQDPSLTTSTSYTPHITLAVFSLGTNVSTAYKTGDFRQSSINIEAGGEITAAGPDETVTLGSGETLTIDTSGMLHVGGTSISLSQLNGLDVAASVSTPSQGEATLTQVGALLTIGSATATAVLAGSSGVVEIEGHTLSIGGAALSSLGHTFSALQSGILEDGSLISFETSTITLPHTTGINAADSLPAVTIAPISGTSMSPAGGTTVSSTATSHGVMLATGHMAPCIVGFLATTLAIAQL
jgi:hypothetical protein